MTPPGALREALSAPRSWPLLLVRATVTTGALAGLVAFIGPGVLLDALHRAPPATWAGALAGLFAGHLLAAMKWRLFVRASGADAGAVESLRAHGAGLFANLCLPSLVGGDVIRAGMLARRHSIAALAVGSIADRLVDTTALLVLAAVGAALVPGLLPASTQTALASIGAVVVAGALGAPLALRAIPAESLPPKLRGPVAKLRDATQAFVARPSVALAGTAIALGVQGAFVALNAMLGRAVGIDVPFAVWLLCWPLAKIVALAPISLGGLGVREAALAALLGAFGVASAAAVGQSLLWQGALIALGLASGALAFGTGTGAGGLGSRGDGVAARAEGTR